MLMNIFGGSSSYQQSNKPAKAEKTEKPQEAEKAKDKPSQAQAKPATDGQNAQNR